MMRIELMALLLFLFSIPCMGQTFQYSRGWTNGKRALTTASGNHFSLGENGNLREVFDEQQNVADGTLEKCLLQLNRYLRNPLLAQTSKAFGLIDTNNRQQQQQQQQQQRNNDNGANNNNYNNNNPLYASHHQSFELYGKAGGGDGIDSSADDYVKH